uniref:Uncharacterized protein LOC117347166 n=1 Tax=Geotrypetes seraphini TaxID=260995 RepID=A0A6P8NRX3_GEOSA|nr:uncharacterized protein LOC117347166 [Geotrypetes seraphini]
MQKHQHLWIRKITATASIPRCTRTVTTITAKDQVRSLGIFLDANSSLSNYISQVVSSSFYNLRQLRKIRIYFSEFGFTQLLYALVLSCMDYCNALFSGLTAKNEQHLQCVQNAANRLLKKTSVRATLSPGSVGGSLAACSQTLYLQRPYASVQIFARHGIRLHDDQAPSVCARQVHPLPERNTSHSTPGSCPSTEDCHTTFLRPLHNEPLESTAPADQIL